MNTPPTPQPCVRARPRLSLVLLLLFAFTIESSAAVIYSVTISTTPWTGQNGSLAFDLIGGDAAVANNTAGVSALATNGTLGSLADFSLTDVNFFNEVLRDATFGTSLSFTLELTDNRTAPGVDQFSFFLLDMAGLPLVQTTDPTGADALFAFDFTGTSGSGLSSFAAVIPGVSWTITPLPPPTTNVPEGGSASSLLLVSMIICFVAARLVRINAEAGQKTSGLTL